MDLAMDAQGALVTLFYMDRDPVRAMALNRPLIEYQRRAGNRWALLLAAGNGAEIAVDTGDWAWAERTMRDLLEMDLTTWDRAMTLHLSAIQWLLRGRDATGMMAEADALTADATDLDFPLDTRAWAAFLSGDLRAAILIWREFARISPLNAPMALVKAARAGLWSRDAEAVEEDLARLAPLRVGRRSIDAHGRAIEAGRAALLGDATVARAAYRAALAEWRDLRLPFPEALACLDLVLLLGPDDADAPAATERAREVFTELGAEPFLAKLDEAMAQAPGDRSASIR